MKPFLSLFILLAFPLTLTAQSGPAPDEFDILPIQILTQVELIEVSQQTLTELLAAPKTSSDDSQLRAKLANLIEKNQAKVVETMSCISRPGQKASSKSVREFTYPVSYKPALKKKSPDKKLVPFPRFEAEVVAGPMPEQFQTRHLGSVLEVEPFLADNDDVIDLRLRVEISAHTGDTVWMEWKDSHGDASVRMPDFYNLNIRTSLSLCPGQPTLAAVLSPKNEHSMPDTNRKIMAFVRTEILQVGLPAQQPADLKSTTTPDPLRLDAVPDNPLPPDTTVVWVANIPALWKTAASTFKAKSLALDPPTPLSKKLAHWADDSKDALPPGALLLAGPANNEFIVQTNRNVAGRLGNAFPPLSIPNPTPDDMALVGAVNESLKFMYRFALARNSRLPFRTTTGNFLPVRFFGISAHSQIDYNRSVSFLGGDTDRNIYTLSLETSDPSQVVILSTGGRERSIAEAIESVRALRKSDPPNDGRPLDLLRIPVIEFKTMADFTDALQGSIAVPGSAPRGRIAADRQYVQFKMDESGVAAGKLLEQSARNIDPFAPLPKNPIRPCDFRFDRPFFLFIWRNNADIPWFAAHIDGNAALTF